MIPYRTNRSFAFFALTCLMLAATGFVLLRKKPRILVFTKTAGFYHESIAVARPALYHLAEQNGFAVDTTTDAAVFTRSGLKKYAAVVFLSTTGDVLNDKQQEAFERFIRSGKGFVGIHAAADTEYNWPWYNQLVGAYFKNHPFPQEASLDILNTEHPATEGLPNPWKRKDEWYNYKSIQNGLHVLINLDEKSYKGGQNGDLHPIAWYHDFDGGRAFYTGLGHPNEAWADPVFLKHVLGGVKYAVYGL